jgi:hypothetical protein
LGKSIYLKALPAEVSPFEAAYSKLLKVQLLNGGSRVVEDPRDAQFVLSFESQLVSHGNRDFCCFNPTTIWSTVGYGVTHFFTGDYSGDDRSTRQDLLVTIFVHTNTLFPNPATAASPIVPVPLGPPVAAASQIVNVPPGDAHLYVIPTRDVFADWR